MYLFTTFILSLFLTIALVPVFKRMAFRMHLVDEPDARKVHLLPMPRSGGISMAIGALAPVLVWAPIDGAIKAVLLGCGVIVAFGILDDVKDLKYWQKLGAQVAGAVIVMVYGGVRIKCLGDMLPGGMDLPYVFSLGLTLFFVVGVTNAINLSDGLDGLAGGVSMLSFVSIAFFAFQSGNMALSLMCIAVAGAILGFLRYNTHPAVVFMGDAGSQMLGFLCVVFTLMLTQANTPYSEILPLFLIGFPIIDTLTVMIERMAKGNSPFKPDKNHFHHRLMKLGLYHSESVTVIYLLQAMFLCCAFLLRFYSNWLNLGIFLGLAAFIVLFFALARQTGFKFRNGEDSLLGAKSFLARFGGDKFSIKFFFAMLRWGLAIVFVLQCLIPKAMPWYMSAGGAVFIALILGAKYFRPQSKKAVIRVCLYCSIPFLMYESTVNPGNWVTDNVQLVNYAALVGLILAVIGTLNLTKRQKGFKFNPLDFLIFIVIIVFPNLPSIHLEIPELKVAVASALILFFSYDVLLGELRPENHFLDRSLVAAFTIMAIRGFI
ncbi:MAG: undecaprenyl/decaprenyl-phosphate alpha-N-acetylglucosaminyl 1-phosphate transferase [Desulfobacter sp.]|nr:MAG: undecaprenyl/decaprenyl-phosphate alpha-N-acetylglucosaminyl 1-phosphate transferase [Desulfobacter sp.]